jgi:hypothetical protein
MGCTWRFTRAPARWCGVSRAALAHGGCSDGEPGLRPHYDANYFAAFVRDPDGNKLEAFTYAA